MSSQAASETTAIIYIGNSGAGKSTLLNKLGGNFRIGVSWRKGVTKDVSEQWVELKGEKVLLMDVPGLFEPTDDGTARNARMLAQALRRGYRYNLTFVLKASNRGFEDADLLMMSKVNEYVRGVDGSKVTFKVIINQIMDDAVYNMYNETMAKDNFRSLFAKLKEEGLHFDIKINSVLLLRRDQYFVQKKTSEELMEFECRRASSHCRRVASHTIAIMYIGNSGVGKSTLLNKLGGDFRAGVSWRKGLTKSVSEKWVELKGKRVLLMDVPGLFEPKKEETEHNVRMLTHALRRGYRYNLTFVLRASNRGFEEADMRMISKVNECVRGVDGLDVTFKAIINQINDDEVYDMYNETVAKDNFRSQFAELKEEGYHFDIRINSVLLLRHDQDFVHKQTSKVLTDFECRWGTENASCVLM
ncbi:hypothetical protein DFQ26_004720 [Actinomortierella ambigua]|nr:hypothetical protein DFQ26_004720 [Actinomortierella ambigua]